MKIVFGVIFLGIIVFVHEFGHFFVSKILGITVESFSIGMGPVLLRKKMFGTEWRISLLPFGGYCALKGEKDSDEEFIEHEKDSFYGKPPIFRALVGIAGPLANVLFAIFSFTLVSMVGTTYYSNEPIIQISSEINSNIHSSAFDAGLRSGDKILSINNEEIQYFTDISKIVSDKIEENVEIVVERNGIIQTYSVFVEKVESDNGKVGRIGVSSTKVKSEKLNFFSAILKGTKDTFSFTKNYVKEIASLFKLEKSISESISGPARITATLGEVTEYGFSAVMTFMAFISISLFFMNLLPIPILDGWLVLISLIEVIIQKRVSNNVKRIAQIIGLTLLILLFLVAITSDIKYFAELFNAKK